MSERTTVAIRWEYEPVMRLGDTSSVRTAPSELVVFINGERVTRAPGSLLSVEPPLWPGGQGKVTLTLLADLVPFDQ